jgi:hypothetical protein
MYEMASKKMIKSNGFSKSNREHSSSSSSASQRKGQNRLAASLTGRFLAGGEVPVSEKRPESILGVRGTHSSLGSADGRSEAAASVCGGRRRRRERSSGGRKFLRSGTRKAKVGI